MRRDIFFVGQDSDDVLCFLAKVELVILGKSKCFGKNSTLSACLVDAVEGV